MKYSIDGGITFLPAPEGIRLVIEATASTEVSDEEPVELHLTVTGEGVIKDVYASREESLDTCLGTEAEQFDDLVCALIEAN